MGFSTTATIFANFLKFYMWFYKGKNVNIPATMQKFIVALFYKINPVQITTTVAENTNNSLNSVPHTIEISIQICEKFSPIVKQNLAFFSSCHSYCYTIIANCSCTLSCQKKQLIAHKVYCEEECTKVLQTHDFPFIYTLYDFWCYKRNSEASHKRNNN